MRELSATEVKRLQSCDIRLQVIVREAADHVSLFVVEGHRGQEAQDKAFREGKSKLKWPHGKHNATPSRAVDLAPCRDGAIQWSDRAGYKAIKAAMFAAAARNNIRLRWGADWDMDGKTRADGDPDERFVDMPHFELVET